VANKAKQQRGLRALLPAFMLRSVPASIAFEPRSKNKKRGDKRGVLEEDLKGKETTRPVRVIIKVARIDKSGLDEGN